MGDTRAGGGDTTRVPGPSEVFGRYRLVSLVGEGGMGQVWRAHDSQTNRVVALKVLPERSADDEGLRGRFRRECRAVAQLTEPHVIPIHDFGDIEGRLFLNMRLVEGTDLRSVIRAEGALAPRRVVGITAQVASALQAAHDVGLVHRDVKPSNVLLAAEDFAYLIDFGIAHAVGDHSLTQAGETIGTFAYLAPEAIGAADRTDARVDVYALACVLHECLTGSPPFATTGGIPALVNDHLHTPPPRPSTAGEGVPAVFDAVIAKGMAKDPDDRYQTPRELAAAAHAAVGDSSTGPVTTVDLARRKRRIRLSRKATAILAAAVVVAVVAVAAITVWMVRSDDSSEQPAAAPSPSGSPAPAKLTPAELDLFKVLPRYTYSSENCTRVKPYEGADAVLTCDKNPVVGAPNATFFHFPSVDDLMRAYKHNARIYRATNCPGDPPGPDGPWGPAEKERGRQACYTNPTVTPPAPTVLIANYDPAVLELFTWTEPGGFDAFRDWWEYGGADLQDAPRDDPDFFTQDDLDLFNALNASEYSKANCGHEDPPPGVKAALGCVANVKAGAPWAFFRAFPDREAILAAYDAELKLVEPPHRCDGSPGGRDDAWLRDGKPVGRYTCFIDPSFDRPTPAVWAIETEGTYMSLFFIAASPDSPDQLPKNEQELAEWFKKTFTS